MGIMLCFFSMSQYMLAFMVPSMNCSSSVPAALMQVQTMTLPPPCLTVGKTHLSLYSSPGCRCHGSWVPGPVLTVSCLYACAYVWAGVCGCVWLRLIRSSWESSPLGYISSCHALSLVRSLQCLRSSFTVRSGSAIPEPCCFLDSDRRTFGCPLLPCATRLCPTESSVSAYGKLRLCPTESSVSAYGKLRLCPTESSVLPTESSASAYEELLFSFSLCIYFL